MLIIDETIYLERKTTGIIELIIDDYILQIGDTIIFAVKKNACEKNELIRKEVHIDKQANNVEIKINPEDTEQLDYGCYFYGITIKLKNGDIFPIIKTNKFSVERVIPNV